VKNFLIQLDYKPIIESILLTGRYILSFVHVDYMETTVIAVLLSAIYTSTFYIDAANNIHNSRLLANQRKIAVASM
jgi:hypothetical protein